MIEAVAKALVTYRGAEKERKDARTNLLDLAVKLGADQDRLTSKGGNVVDWLDGYLVGHGQKQAWRKVG